MQNEAAILLSASGGLVPNISDCKNNIRGLELTTSNCCWIGEWYWIGK